jgi:hypothetical protein
MLAAGVDPNVSVASFHEELARVVDERRPELLVVYTPGGESELWELHDFLSTLGVPGTVYDTPAFEVVEDDWSPADVEQLLAVCGRGCLVVFGELRPADGGFSHRLGLAARCVQAGATVLAIVRAATREAAENRLHTLLAQEREEENPFTGVRGSGLPAHRLLAFPF